MDVSEIVRNMDIGRLKYLARKLLTIELDAAKEAPILYLESANAKDEILHFVKYNKGCIIKYLENIEFTDHEINTIVNALQESNGDIDEIDDHIVNIVTQKILNAIDYCKNNANF